MEQKFMKKVGFLIAMLIGIGFLNSCLNNNATNNCIHIIHSYNNDSESTIEQNVLLCNDFEIPFIDSVNQIRKNRELGISFDQLITSRKYIFGQDTISITFTDYGRDYYGFDSLNSAFLYEDNSLGLIAINSFSPGSRGACGGADYIGIDIYKYNEIDGLRWVSGINFDSCLGQLIIQDEDFGKEYYIDKVYWEESYLVFISSDSILAKFSSKTEQWEK